MPRKRVRSFCFSATTSSGRRVHSLYAQFLRSGFCGLEVSSRISVLFLCGTATFFARHSWASLLSFLLPPHSRFRLQWTLTLVSSGPLRFLFASHLTEHRVLQCCGMAFFVFCGAARSEAARRRIEPTRWPHWMRRLTTLLAFQLIQAIVLASRQAGQIPSRLPCSNAMNIFCVLVLSPCPFRRSKHPDSLGV